MSAGNHPVIPAQAGIHPRRIALLGAESTGKSTLAWELAEHLRSQGLTALAVPEVLREWCTRTGRAPEPGEQLAIAEEQEARVDAAARQAEVVIADTTALMVAIYAGMLFRDGALYRFSVARQQAYDATLVTGLDLPWTPDGLQRDAASREAVDALVRNLLQENGVPYQVVYGEGERRLHSAVQALAACGVLPQGVRAGEATPAGGGAAWVWVCDKCSDPACEHRLFQKLRDAQP